MAEQTNLYFVNTQYSRRRSGGRNLFNSFFFSLSIILGCATCVLSCAKMRKTKRARKTEKNIQTRDLIYHWTFIWPHGLVAPEIQFSLDMTHEARNQQKIVSHNMSYDFISKTSRRNSYFCQKKICLIRMRHMYRQCRCILI